MIIKKLLIVALTSSFLMVTGCSSLNGPDIKADPRFDKDEGKFFSKSSVLACAGGAVLGTGLSLLVPNPRITISVVSGFLGCLSGMTANYVLDELRARYHNAEDQLNDLIEQIKVAKNVQKFLETQLNDVYVKDLNDIEKLNEEIAYGKKQKSENRIKAQAMNANIEKLKDKVEKAHQLLESFEVAKNSLSDSSKQNINNRDDYVQKIAKLDDEIEELKFSIRLMEQEIDAYQEKSISLIALADE